MAASFRETQHCSRCTQSERDGGLHHDLSEVISDFNEQIKNVVGLDVVYEKLRQQVLKGETRKYWLESDLLMLKGGRLYVPMGGLWKELLKETHNAKGAGHPGEERTMALLSKSYYWPRIGEDVQAYVKSCLVCQLDKTEKKKMVGLLQPLPYQKIHGKASPWISSRDSLRPVSANPSLLWLIGSLSIPYSWQH